MQVFLLKRTLWHKCFPANALRNIYENIFKWPDEKFGPTLLKSSSSHIFFKIYIFKNFSTFTEKHLCWNLFLIKLQTSRPATQVLKRDCNTGVFLRILKKIKNSFFIEHFVAAFFYSSRTFAALNFESTSVWWNFLIHKPNS